MTMMTKAIKLKLFGLLFCVLELLSLLDLFLYGVDNQRNKIETLLKLKHHY